MRQSMRFGRVSGRASILGKVIMFLLAKSSPASYPITPYIPEITFPATTFLQIDPPFTVVKGALL